MGEIMKRALIIAAAVLLTNCGAPADRREHKSESEAKAISPQYAAAVRCWVLADIVETLVENDVTAKQSFKTFAQTELQWRTRAMTIGAKYGLSERKVQGDFETDQITLLTPIQEKPRDEAAIYIQQMVGAAGECHVSDN